MPLSWCLDAVILVSSTSPRCPRPSCSVFSPREQLLATEVGSLVVVVVMTVLVLAFP